MTQPTALEQYMLELVNAERAKAGSQPLAFDSDLNQAADGHSRWMLSTDTFSHRGSGGSSAGERMTDAGYSFSGSWARGENIAWASTRPPSTGYQDEVQLLHTNLMNSSGHRANILKDSYREIGIGFQVGEYKDYNAGMVTQDFARTATNPFLTGVAFDDKDGDRLYDPGEGLAGLTVTATGSAGTFKATTMDAGGYQMTLPTGSYTVSFSGTDIPSAMSQQVTIGTKNVKADLVAITGTSGDDTLYGTSDANTIKGLGGNDRLYGQSGNDKLYGQSGDDRVAGGTGNDYVSGSHGNDTLYGNEGRDTFFGGSGNDVLIGGADADVFRFRSSWGSDRINDFQNGLDKLDMRYNDLSFSELQIGATNLDQDGLADDVMISADGQSVGLLNTSTTALDSSDFWF